MKRADSSQCAGVSLYPSLITNKSSEVLVDNYLCFHTRCQVPESEAVGQTEPEAHVVHIPPV